MAVDDSVVRAGYSSTLPPPTDVPVAGHPVDRRILSAFLRCRWRISRPEEPLEEEDRVGELQRPVVVRVPGIETRRLVGVTREEVYEERIG